MRILEKELLLMKIAVPTGLCMVSKIITVMLVKTLHFLVKVE